MKITYDEWMSRLNVRLSEYNQSIRVSSYSHDTLSLSNGEVLQDNSFNKFKKRVMNKKTTSWVSNMDNLINNQITEKEIKSRLAAIGGSAVQAKYGEKIRSNLNKGTPWNAGTKGQNIGKLGPRPQTVKDSISEKNAGPRNGMYGVKMSDVDKKLRSDIMQKKILSGEFTPNSNNRNTHWESVLDGKKYRSSWEALYQYINPSAEYETLRIEYVLSNKNHVYIVDFIDHTNKLVVEVKPRELCVGEKFNAKIMSLKSWATIHGYTAILVDKEWLQEQATAIDYHRFDDNTAKKIQALYETN